jgi:hypothetical protein
LVEQLHRLTHRRLPVVRAGGAGDAVEVERRLVPTGLRAASNAGTRYLESGAQLTDGHRVEHEVDRVERGLHGLRPDERPLDRPFATSRNS